MCTSNIAPHPPGNLRNEKDSEWFVALLTWDVLHFNSWLGKLVVENFRKLQLSQLLRRTTQEFEDVVLENENKMRKIIENEIDCKYLS